jgi:O-antigen/teichoic acid export membrane protein
LLVFHWHILGALLAIMVSNLIICIYLILRIQKEIPGSQGIKKPVLKSLLRYGLIYSVSTVFMLLHVRIDILILARMTSMEQLGYYSLAVAIATNWQIPFSVGGVIISKSAGSENLDVKNANIAKLLRVAFLLGLASYLILYFMAPVVVQVLYGIEFMPGVVLIRALLPGILLLILSNILSSRLAGDGKPQIFMYIAIPSLIINIILNFLWIPEFSALGAAYATDVSYAFQALVGIIVYSAIVKMPVKKLFGYKKSDFDFIPVLINSMIKRLKQ